MGGKNTKEKDLEICGYVEPVDLERLDGIHWYVVVGFVLRSSSSLSWRVSRVYCTPGLGDELWKACYTNDEDTQFFLNLVCSEKLSFFCLS